MTNAGLAAVIVLVLTNAGALIAAGVSMYRAREERSLNHAQRLQIEAELNKDISNRRQMLERYADQVARYHRDLRIYLMKLIDAGIIDASRVDLSTFPQPPLLPPMNGDDR